jgi:hypothetical protein
MDLGGRGCMVGLRSSCGTDKDLEPSSSRVINWLSPGVGDAADVRSAELSARLC